MRLKKHFILILAFAGASCVSTKVASIKDPSYRTASFGRFLVVGNYEKMESANKVETVFAADLRSAGVYAIENFKLLPPLRSYSDSEKRAAFIAEGLDGYLIVSPAGVNTSTLHFPTTSTTYVNASSDGYGGAYGTATTTTSPSYSEDIVNSVDIKAELFDISNGKLVWRGETNTDINHFFDQGAFKAGFNDIVHSASSNLVDELERNALIRRQK